MAKTVEDFLRLPEGTLAELIDGEILTSPAPREKHQDAVGNLFADLRSFVHAKRLGRVFVAPFDVHLPSGAVVEPDLIFVSAARAGIVQDWVRGSPDLLVEVLPPDSIRRDRVRKHALDAENGVLEYWIVDPLAETVEVLALKAGAYAELGSFRADDAVTSPSWPASSSRRAASSPGREGPGGQDPGQPGRPSSSGRLRGAECPVQESLIGQRLTAG